MSSSASVSKSVRLPVHLVEFLEAQEGGTFSEKLIGLLEECRTEGSDLQKQLGYYKRQLTRYERLYKVLVNDYSDARRIITHAEKYLGELSRLTSKELKELQEPEDPDLIPGNLPFT